MLYHGNTLIDEVYHGSTKIGEIYHGSTLVYQSSKYDIDEVVYESSTAGTVSFNLLETGKYEVYCIAGGGGYHGKYGGGSGSGFIGIIQVTKGILALRCGGGGAKDEYGGNSTIGDYVTSYGGSPASISSGGSGGANPTISATIISTTLNTAGIAGTMYFGGAAVYGSYGKGADPDGTGNAGYIKLIFKGKH